MSEDLPRDFRNPDHPDPASRETDHPDRGGPDSTPTLSPGSQKHAKRPLGAEEAESAPTVVPGASAGAGEDTRGGPKRRPRSSE
jgi:hypothetical protein